jgi:4-diphosphocytidyl-2-C-methyl-D-erythritol kinase
MELIKKYHLRSPAKINLYLRVIKKLSNNYHEIDSLISHVGVFDEITVLENKNKQTSVKFFGEFSKLISNKNNSIISVISLLKKLNKKIKEKNFTIKVKKNIPVGSGLGGGTSNAVTILKFLQKRFNLKIKKNNLKQIYSSIGADSKVFADSNLKFISGYGDKVHSYKAKIKLNILLIFPNKPNFTKLKIDVAKKMIGKNIFNFLNIAGNDLLLSAKKLNLPMSNLLAFLERQNICDFIQMSGSGSCCYAVFKSKKSLLKCQKLVKIKYRSYWTAVTKTIT